MPKKTGPSRAGSNRRPTPPTSAGRGSGGTRPPARSTRPAGRGPLSGGTPVRRDAPPAAGLRGAVERKSYPVLLWLSGLPRLLPAVAFLAVAAAGLLLPPPFGPALLVLVVALMVWLTYLSWPVTTVGAKVLRVVLIALVSAGAVAPFFGT